MNAPRSARRVLLATTTVVALLAVPASASATAKHVLEFKLQGSGGYQLIVTATPGQPNAAIRVSHNSNAHSTTGVAVTDYIARARVTSRRISAEFEGLGRIDVHFHPSGRLTQGQAQQECRGPDHVTTRFGSFRGAIEFEGEGGYTSIHARRAAGTDTSPPSLQSGTAGKVKVVPDGRRQRPAGGAESRSTAVQASSRRGLLALAFEAMGGTGGRALYLATSEETRGQLAISHFAFAPGSPRTFATDSALSFASVSPPAPFSGTGTLERTPTGHKIWAGTLAVSFPGAPDVPLTGPQFKTQLTRGW